MQAIILQHYGLFEKYDIILIEVSVMFEIVKDKILYQATNWRL